LEIRHLRYFIAIAESGGFARAASRLHVAQPALSRQIRDLEEELDVTLFDRGKRGVRLTYPGECFLDDSRRLLSQLERAQKKARRAQTGEVGALKIGLVESFSWNDVITGSIRAFRNQNPNVTLTMLVMSTAEQLAAIRDRRLTGGFLLNRPRQEKTFDGIKIFTDKVLIAVSDTSPFARRPPKHIAELAQEDFFWFPRRVNPVYYDEIIHACQKSGLTPKIVQGGLNDTANLSLVAAGLGCTFVPAETKYRKPKNVVLVAVDDLDVTITMEFIWHRENRQQALRNFIDILRRTAESNH
jgi:DNA-binding transcriptional LysR family regulator